MKKCVLVVAMLIISATFSFGKKAEKSYTGEVMDSRCAKMGNHDAGYKMTGTNTPKDCAQACVKAGGKYVLYDETAKTPTNSMTRTKPKTWQAKR
jgi:hypothetical protein